MRITQGAFSFLPDLTDAEIRAQVDYALVARLGLLGRAHRRRASAQHLLGHVGTADVRLEGRRRACCSRSTPAARRIPNHYIKVNAFDSTRGVESMVLSFIVHRPADEPGFALVRQEAGGRNIRYTTRGYATDKPAGERYR